MFVFYHVIYIYQVYTKCHMVMYSFHYSFIGSTFLRICAVPFCDDQGSKYSLFLEYTNCIFVQIKLNSKYGAENYLLYSLPVFNTISMIPFKL